MKSSMRDVLQSEIRLHEGILAGLTLQNPNGTTVDPAEVAARMEHAITNLKEAVQSEEIAAQHGRLLNLLFNLQEMIAAFKLSLQNLYDKHETLPSSLANGIEWMEDLAETWSLSLDQEFMADINSRLVTQPRPSVEIRNWHAVLDEVERDAEVHG